MSANPSPLKSPVPDACQLGRHPGGVEAHLQEVGVVGEAVGRLGHVVQPALESLEAQIAPVGLGGVGDEQPLQPGHDRDLDFARGKGLQVKTGPSPPKPAHGSRG